MSFIVFIDCRIKNPLFPYEVYDPANFTVELTAGSYMSYLRFVRMMEYC